MLVLTRKVHESVVVGDSIEIMVTKIVAGRVLIGIRAPREITVRRAELPIHGKQLIEPSLTAEPHASVDDALPFSHAAV